MQGRHPAELQRSGINRQFSAGGAVYKLLQNSEVSWLVTRSKPSKDFPKDIKRLPKGWIDDEKGGGPGPVTRGDRKATEEELQQSALREVREEGGIEAKIIKKVGSEKWFFTIGSDRIFKFVTYFLMEWKEDLPEGFGEETAEIYWLPFEEAYKVLSYSSEKKILKKAKELLSSGTQESLI